MIAPFVLLICSAIAFAVSTLPGLGDIGLLAIPCGIASAYLLLRGYLARKGSSRWRDENRSDPGKPAKPRWQDIWLRRSTKAGRVIVIDGSNVMHWNGGGPHIDTVRAVVNHLSALGFSPGGVFDANAGHILTGKYRHHAALGAMLGLPEDRVMVVDKGTPADPIILAAAHDAGAQIVTNDRYRDWAETHALVRETGRLVRGGYSGGKLWLDASLEVVLAATP